MRIQCISLVIFFALLLGACSAPKDVTYFQGVDDLSQEQLEQMSQSYSTKISPDDLLTITVTGWDPSVLTPFNPPVFSYIAEGEEKIQKSDQLQTYLVYKDGSINFPILGKVQAAGFSKQELAENLRVAIDKYVKGVNVNVQIVNFKVTLMGEVARPGAVAIKNDRVSILDVLGLVGDLTINANRKNILVIRDKDGKKEFGRVDITDPAIFTSPYFYLRQNDVVYVEPNEAKKKNARYSQAQQYSITVFTSILSAISVITTVILAITK
ncbi:MAG: polysaccharide biosynthesis/export family protein [Parabacteroides sp.]|nr:polysaccharide biosynthesis/export family protein [Parabacteroides sp.]